MEFKKRKLNKGYTLIEMIFYIALFAILTMAVINSLIMMTKALKETAIQADFVQSSAVMERISREIRQAYGVYSISASDLKLNIRDESGNPKTVRFVLTGSNVALYENDILTGNLNTANVSVNSLSFVQIITVKGSAIKIILIVRSTRDITNRLESFYDTIVLRGGYGS